MSRNENMATQKGPGPFMCRTVWPHSVRIEFLTTNALWKYMLLDLPLLRNKIGLHVSETLNLKIQPQGKVHRTSHQRNTVSLNRNITKLIESHDVTLFNFDDEPPITVSARRPIEMAIRKRLTKQTSK